MCRFSLSSITLRGEPSSAPAYNLAEIQSRIDTYEIKYVFNLDESSLYYKQLASKIVVEDSLKRDFIGCKIIKSRISVVFNVNMDYSIIIPPLFIGKSKHPHCFDHVPVNYTSQKSSWMDSTVFYYYIDNIFVVRR